MQASRRRAHARSWALLALFALALTPARGAATEVAAADLTRLSLEELMDVEVALPSRRLEPRSRASAAVYVITGEDIRRSA